MTQNFRFPAEWEKQQSIWTAFPHDPAEWYDQLAAAQSEIASFAATLASHQVNVHLICPNADIQTLAKCMIHDIIGDNMIDFPIMPYGDIWLRDTGPITITNGQERRGVIFGFNGWGGKYLMQGDQEIGAAIASAQSLQIIRHDMIFEGGAIDVDGAGHAITTKQCVLNSNRNPNLSQNEIEKILCDNLGLEKICWLGDGLIGDHTDGHVDNLARFVGVNHVLIPQAHNNDDPNMKIYDDAANIAVKFGFKVSRIISAGRYVIEDEIAPASYMNFVISNNIVIIPQFNLPTDRIAVETISALFPNRVCMGLSSVALLSGGGSFHCASQQLAAL